MVSQTNLNIAIIGKGRVGSALEKGLKRAEYPVKAVGRDPQQVHQAGEWAQCIILAVPWGALGEAVQELGDAVQGKILVDVTNVLTPEYELALGFTTSGAEELQKQAQGAKVVKAFNTIFAQHMATGKVGETALSLLVAGDDLQAKKAVIALGRAIGFDAIDAGPLKNARLLEPLGVLNIHLGYAQKMGPDIGFRLIH